MTPELYIGLMSGTSLDGIDAALVRLNDDTHTVELMAAREFPFPDSLHGALDTLVTQPYQTSVARIGELHRRLGLTYADAVNKLLQSAGRHANDIRAIGCHGQTIWHAPDHDPAFTVQLGCGATVAAGTGICTVNDLRSADMACGGQGAPIAPLFHNWLVDADPSAAIANLGGIANITLAGNPLRGFDTGPANTLMDIWFRRHHDDAFDRDGEWARSGNVHGGLLERLLDEPYFARPAPKSTGRELFNEEWLNARLKAVTDNLAPNDVQSTLAELTAVTLARGLRDAAAEVRTLYLCGGGAANTFLTERIKALLPDVGVTTTQAVGVPPESVEAVAFAWLARERLAGRAAGSPGLTGASRRAVLGAVHRPPEA